MAAINFPPFTDSDPNPSNGDIWTDQNGTQWEYNVNIPAWKALAKPGPGVVYRGGIDLTLDPNSQYQQIVSGNFFVITVGANPANNAFYPGLGGLDAEEGNEIIYDGTEWQFITVQIPYATTTVAGKVELATAAEAEAGTNNTTAMTPLRVVQSIDEQIPQATTSQKGRTKYASRNEASAADRNDVALTPDSIKDLVNQILSNNENRVPTGMVMWWTAEKDGDLPLGWVHCNGQRIYNNGDTADLYQFLKRVGNTWGDGNNVVRVPDLRGDFIRGYHEGLSSRDPDLEDFGRSQSDEFKRHNHSIEDPGHDHDVEGRREDGGSNLSPRVIVDDDRSGSIKHVDENAAIRNNTNIKIVSEGKSEETRPKNRSLKPVIKL
jgi:microcystin-dependent protein